MCRSSFGRTANFKYGRSAIGAERPILIPSILHCQTTANIHEVVQLRFTKTLPIERMRAPCWRRRVDVFGVE